MIPYGRQQISQSDIDAVLEVLQSDFLTQGPKTSEFEHKVARYCGSKYALAMNSATSALHTACLALELKPGDHLWTSPITFVASANCGLYCGAQVDFVDIDPRNYNLCPIALENKLKQAEKKGCLPKIVIAVHLCGQPCDMEAIHQLSKQYGFNVIEDASHAIGGKYKSAPIGNCEYSDITVFSFHPVKIITTAEGGMACTQDTTLAEKMALLRSHGVTRDPKQMVSESHGPWYYQQVALGFNYRMTDIQAALGISQLERLDDFVNRRHQLAQRYDELLSALPITTPWQNPSCYSAFHLYVIRINTKNANHREVFEFLRSRDIGVNLHYIPIHMQPYYQDMGFKQGDFPQAEQYYEEAISLPLHPGLTEEDQLHVLNALKEALFQ